MIYTTVKETARDFRRGNGAGMGAYDMLSAVYDRLNEDVDYAKWAQFYEECFDRYLPERPTLVLELGCGTGAMTIELARRGYDMTALDISPEMLSHAYSRCADKGIFGVLFLEGDMCDFELYGTVGAVVCCLDGINHLLSEKELADCFALVHNYLDPDGLFLFDVNTPYKFQNIYADNDYVLERDGAVCVWRNRLSDDARQCDFHLTVFEQEEDGLYTRQDGVQSELCYDMDTLKRLLGEAGFEFVAVFADTDFAEIGEKSERWHIVARAKKA